MKPQPEGPATPLHVLPDRVGGWRVVREGADQPLSEHNSETAAEHAAVSEARATDTPEVVVHDCYDRVHPAEALDVRVGRARPRSPSSSPTTTSSCARGCGC